MQHKVNFKRSLTDFSSVVFFLTVCHTKVEICSLPFYLPIAGGRIIGLIGLCEIQSVST